MLFKQASTTKKIEVTDNQGNNCFVTFGVIRQSKIREINQASLDSEGNLDNARLADRLMREMVELLLDVEGIQTGLDADPENAITICSAMSGEDIGKLKDFHENNQLDYSDAPEWKGVFLTMFPGVFERAAVELLASHSQSALKGAVVGK